jgi:CxxC motif-containing protein
MGAHPAVFVEPRAITWWEVALTETQCVAITCVACPQGCAATLTVSGGEVVRISGVRCKQGKEYVLQEYRNPQRVLTSTVRLRNGGWLPVRSRGLVPKALIFEIMDALRGVRCASPVQIGDVVVPNVLGTGVDMVASASHPPSPPCRSATPPSPYAMPDAPTD